MSYRNQQKLAPQSEPSESKENSSEYRDTAFLNLNNQTAYVKPEEIQIQMDCQAKHDDWKQIQIPKNPLIGEVTNRTILNQEIQMKSILINESDEKLQEINFSSEEEVFQKLQREESKNSDEQTQKVQILKSKGDDQQRIQKWSDYVFSEEGTESPSTKSAAGKNLFRAVQSMGTMGKNMVAGMRPKLMDQIQDDFEEIQEKSYKELYIEKYGLKFTIPNLNVHSSAWYPKKPQYFVQIVSYIVPKNEEFEVQTHFLDNKPKNVSHFEEIFKDKITGCCIRLIQTSRDLESIKLIDQYVFDLKPRVDNLNISFSTDGKQFVIYSTVNNFIKIYKFSNIEKILDEIRNDNFIQEIKDKEDIVEASFGNNTKFLIVRFKYKLEIYNMEQLRQNNKGPEVYELPRDLLESICDYYFRSSDANDNYRCYLACKVQGLKKIKVFNIKHLHRESIWETESNSINFFEDMNENFMVKIKILDKQIKTVLVNGNEQFTITMHENGETSQKMLSQLGSKKVKHIYLEKYSENAWCYLVACNTYDDHLHFYKAYCVNFSLKIQRKIQPGIIKVLDVIVTPQGQMRMLSMKDDEFIIDQVQTGPQDHNSYIYSSVRAFNSSWPYITFSGLENYLLLINVYNKQVLHRIQFAPLNEYVMVCQTYISNTKDLFLVIKRGNTFQVLMLDLDELNDRGAEDESVFKFAKVIEYSSDEVMGGNLTSMFVRGSSRKEVIQLNQKLFIFLQHDQNIYSWNEDQMIEDGKKLTHINGRNQVLSPYILVQDDHNIYYFQVSKDNDASISEVVQIKIFFSTYESSVIQSENSKLVDFVGFKVDRVQGIMMLFTKEIVDQKRTDRLFVKIMSLEDEDEVFLECEIFDPHMKGIFMSGEFTLIDGHIYFNNNVIKMRYDLMQKYGGNGKNQEIYFNQYSDILNLNQGQQIKTNCPIDSYGSHRLTYVVINHVGKPKELILVPYLHDRKIYLNRKKQNTEYFYTSKQVGYDPEDVCEKNSFIFAFNLNESKFYTYNEQGLLLKRIEFSEIIKKHGEIVAASQNGLNFALQNKRNDTITIIRFNEQEFVVLKSLNVEISLDQFYSNTNDSELKKQCIDHWAFNKDRFNLQYEIQLNDKAHILIRINRKSDLENQKMSPEDIETVYFFNANFKIDKNSLDDQSRVHRKFSKECKIEFEMFHQEGSFGQNLLILEGIKKFSINEDKMFMWDNYVIEYYDFKKPFTESNKKELNIKISKQEKFASIKDVSTGSKSDSIAVEIDQMQCSQILQWSLSEDIEISSFEVDKNNEIIWDRNGEYLILENGKTTLPFKNCSLKCYQLDNFIDHTKSKILPFSVGHRFDSANHNWIIMEHYICLSFSYMTFVIQSQIEDIDVKDMSEEPLLEQAFDQEAYNYLLDKDSCFTNGKLAKKSFLKLQKVLNKLSEIDEVYLEILHYTREDTHDQEDEENVNMFDRLRVGTNKCDIVTKSALHEAVEDGNNRVVDCIMQNMSQIAPDNSQAFRSILSELTDMQSFATYIENLPTQTLQMQEKKVLRVREALNDNIIAMATSHTAYIDAYFYCNHFNEDHNAETNKAFPVDVYCMRIDWVITTDEGKQFLQAILQSERLDYYEIKGLQIIIEFLYQKSKALLLRYLLPLYLLQGGVFFIVIILQEFRNTKQRGIDLPFEISEDTLHVLTLSFVIMNQCWTLLMVCIMGKVITLQGSSFFRRVYTWFDIIFYSLNTMASALALQGEGMGTIERQRILQAFAILFFLAKNFYFMKLVDEIAPLIDIIIQVFFDIKWFLFVFMAFIMSFGWSFYLIGNNQQEFDELTDKQIAGIPYKSIQSSILFMWNVCLGGGDSSHFTLGNKSQYRYLTTLFICAQFIMLIHLLNMLIAIMGNTFGNRNEVAEQIKIRDHLAFVIDNWFLKDYSLGNTKKIKYIVAAFNHVDSAEDDQIFEKLKDQFFELKKQMVRDHEESTKRQRIIEQNQRNTETQMRLQDAQNKQMQDEIKEQGEILREILKVVKK